MVRQLIGGLSWKKPRELWLLLRALKAILSTAGTEPDPRLLLHAAPPELPDRATTR